MNPSGVRHEPTRCSSGHGFFCGTDLQNCPSARSAASRAFGVSPTDSVQELTMEIQLHEPLASLSAEARGATTSGAEAASFGSKLRTAGAELGGPGNEARGVGSLSGWLLHA